MNELIIDALRKACEWCPECIACKDCEIQKACSYVEEHSWHDLRKNPDDLPAEEGFYMACVEHPMNNIRTMRENHIGYFDSRNIYVRRGINSTGHKKSVIAWRKIEEYDG